MSPNKLPHFLTLAKYTHLFLSHYSWVYSNGHDLMPQPSMDTAGHFSGLEDCLTCSISKHQQGQLPSVSAQQQQYSTSLSYALHHTASRHTFMTETYAGFDLI